MILTILIRLIFNLSLNITIILACVSVSGLKNSQAKAFYVRPQPLPCAPESEIKVTTFPADPWRFVQKVAQDQTGSPTCGFHSGTVLLEALIHSQSSVNQILHYGNSPIERKKALNVLDALIEAGFCPKKKNITISQINSVPFYLKMRNGKSISTHYKTTRNFLESSSDLYPRAPSLRSLDADADLMVEKILDRYPIPPFNIQTWQLTKADTSNSVIHDILIPYFKKPSPLPIDLGTCVDDTQSRNGCDTLHAIALLGIKQTSCTNGEGKTISSLTGIFKNSGGEIESEYDLKSMVDGVIKHELDFTAIRPCHEGNCLNPPFILHKKANPIYDLASVGDAESIRQLTRNYHLDLNMTRNKLTPLGVATALGHVEVVKALLAAKADPYQRVFNGIFPLTVAAYNGRMDLVEAFLDAGVDNTQCNTDFGTPLQIAVVNENWNMVKLFVDKHPFHLHFAAKLNSNTMVKALLKVGASPKIIDEHGRTPLHYAASQLLAGEMVRHLLNAGASVDIQDKYGDTPLYFAQKEGVSGDILEILAEKMTIDQIESELKKDYRDRERSALEKSLAEKKKLSSHQ